MYTRRIAARASIALMADGEVPQYVTSRLALLTTPPSSGLLLPAQNALHGLLLQLTRILENARDSSVVVRQGVSKGLLPLMADVVCCVKRENPSFVTRSAFLDFVLVLLSGEFALEVSLVFVCFMQYF